MILGKFNHRHHLAIALIGVGKLMELRHILIVHTDHQVEVIEVISADLTRAMFQTISALIGCTAHTAVGEIAGMAAIETGAVALHFNTSLGGKLLGNALRCRTPTDIAETNEEKSHGTLLGARRRHCRRHCATYM